MQCPQCQSEMARGRDFFVCLNCRTQIADRAPSSEMTQSAGLDTLPSIIALPWSAYRHESNPVLRLHRACDAVEVLTRFCTIVALGEWRQRLGDGAWPPELITLFQSHVERPTFGLWKEMLLAIVEQLKSGSPLVVPELVDFVTNWLRPAIAERVDRLVEGNIINLRNQLVHGGAVTQYWCRDRLEAVEPWLADTVLNWAFLSGIAVCHLEGDRAVRLVGTAAEGARHELSESLRFTLRDLDGHVILLRGERYLDLWPLCAYGRASSITLSGPRESPTASPWVYARGDRERLLYAVLGSEEPHGERKDVVTSFRALFQLDERVALARTETHELDFEADLRADSDRVIGRVQQIDEVVKTLKQAPRGVYWLWGPAGIGKSYVVARVACTKTFADEQKWLRIAWRFKASNQDRGNRTAFLRHAVKRLARWLAKPDHESAPDAAGLSVQLEMLLKEIRAFKPLTEHPQAKPRRVLFVLDGLDEIAAHDPEVVNLPFRFAGDNIVWLCSGRPEGNLPAKFATSRCTHLFADGGLPPMNQIDIRAMLLEGCGSRRFPLLELDQEVVEPDAGAVHNPVVNAIVDRAAGLPLYVELVIKDILGGEFQVSDLPQRLPPSLNAYYDELLQRLAIADLHALLTPLVVTICQAKAPLDEATLHQLLLWRTVVTNDAYGRQLMQQGLEAVRSMLRAAPIAEGGFGWIPYHESFRQHVVQDADKLRGQNQHARDSLCRMAMEWKELDGSARSYALRYGIPHLLENHQWDSVNSLLTDLPFLEAKNGAGLAFDLVSDFHQAVADCPKDNDPRILNLLFKALRRDISFIHYHHADYPQGLFQCLWNLCWWYDCPEAEAHYVKSEVDCRVPLPWARPGEKLYELLERWRSDRERANPNGYWIKSRRPPAVALGSALLAAFRGHNNLVQSVSWSPDGTRIASGSWDKVVAIWDNDSSAVLAAVTGNQSLVSSVAWSPDGTRIAIDSWNGVRVLDAATGTELAVLGNELRHAGCITWSPNGNRIVRGSIDGTLRLWDATSGTELAVIQAHEDDVKGVSWSPNGARIASGSFDKTVRVWDAVSGSALLVLRGHEHFVCGVSWSPDGARIVSGSVDKTVRVWDADSGSELAVLHGHEDQVFCVSWSPDGTRIASGSMDRTIRVWDAKSWAELALLRGHDNVVSSVAWSPDGTRIASGSWDYTARVWDPGGDAGLAVLREHERDVKYVCWSFDETRIVSASDDKTLRLWDADNGVELKVLCGHEDWVTAAAWSPDGRRIVSGSSDMTVRVWDATNGAELAQFCGHEDTVHYVNWSPSGTRIASNSYDWTLRIWDDASGAELAAHRGVTCLGFKSLWSQDESRIFALGLDGKIRSWDTSRVNCSQMSQENLDRSAFLDNATSFPLSFTEFTTETWVSVTDTSRPVACFPERLREIAPHSGGRIWASNLGSHLFILELMGGEDGTLLSSALTKLWPEESRG